MRLTGGLSVRFSQFAKFVPHFIVSSLMVGAVFAGSGCGSGSGSPTPSPSPSATPVPTPSPSATPAVAPVTVTTRVVWGPRSRQVGVQVNAIGGPSSALSATITLVKATPTGGDLTLNVNRSVQNGPQDYTSDPQQARPGIYTLNATFYALNNQQGAVVGTAQASVTVLGNGTLSTTIATVGKIQKVVVVPGGLAGLQGVRVGQTADIAYSALDASDQVIAITPGSAFVTVVPNTLPNGTLDTITRATASGETVTGVAPNQATIIVRVDGVSSAPTLIRILSNVTITVNPGGAVVGPNTPPNPLIPAVSVGLGQFQSFVVSVAGDGPAGQNGVIFQVLLNGVPDTAQVGGVLSTPGPGFSTTFTATSVLGNQTNATHSYVLRITSIYDPSIFVDVPLLIQSGTLPVIVQ